ncbi:MAG: GNAT family N-acetyltransferase [Candidatus Saccharimonadales bacterium]
MDEIKVEVIPAMMVPIVARQTAMDPAYVKKLTDMMSRDEIVLLAARRDAGGYIDNYIGRVSLWLAPAEESEVRRSVPQAAMVTKLQVNERARLQGIARQLMLAAEDAARARGRHQLALGVEPGNQAARKLYESLGYAYHKALGHDTYQASWDETDEQGGTKRVTVEAMLMVKEI